ncbi:hypothetical protein BJX63DRAFT_398003 [Aspergillus granulosus]|uniref:Uncharacterized protein n=1 Tax=Aspergillus granulosus TaxID=176169 RepID=A0ABR4H997_9EURO
MRFAIFAWTGIALASQVAAFWGQMAASAYYNETTSCDTTIWQTITLTDYYTGSQYEGDLWGGFNGCAGGHKCDIFFWEVSEGDYDFTAKMWRADDGCHHIDFKNALDAHHGYCCGSLPCNFSA